MLAQQVFNGLALGMGYALIAVGYSLIFGILRLVNFSHGSIYAFGAEIAMVFIVSMKFGIVPGILLSMLVTGVLGIMIDKIALEPLRKKGSPPIASLITTIGISNIITNLLIVFIGSEKRNFPNIFGYGMTSWQFFDYLLETVNIVGTPGSGFGPSGEGYFRLTAFGSAENTKEAIERIVKM